MKLKIPPVVVTFVFGLFMYALATFLPVGYFEFFGRLFLVYLATFGALTLGILAVWKFFKAKTTINPATPKNTSQLVTRGVYRYSRNPMYLALLLVLIGWGLWLGNAFNSLILAGFVGYMNKFQIIPEEQILIQLFGKPYQKYLTEVRRWF
ncbi:isoprenylcysteine carboxylmethyltransferase family protein [Arenibacter sp. GZD96]|uniref:methyltransferase family protein n=1 Tax=Aurantibrevibacter litoralis TaxID=3106030 RepID=UPI002AFEE5AC|nr:isoprenylcysteine carboxylmethyltransferase family protein [Arenibacter sp. GZD-96]MEA1786893.1 isoprenylcysteine carboxylmethyltransferase family protein [Arenibacter sp. GZD-96]